MLKKINCNPAAFCLLPFSFSELTEKYAFIICFITYFVAFHLNSSLSHFLSCFLCPGLFLIALSFGVSRISQAVQEAEQEDVKMVADSQAPKSTKKTKAATGGCQTGNTRQEKKGKQKG